MNKTLSNSLLTVTVKQRGAELCSIKGAGGMEYMWQADPKIWGRHAPVLFPIVGRLNNNRYTLDGKTYEMDKHGFARNMDFELVSETPESLSYRLRPTLVTKKSYPFDFVLTVSYELKNNCLTVKYEVRNKTGKTMPFSIGAHPGFSLKWNESDVIEDYFLEFENAETVDTHLLTDDILLSRKTKRVLTKENVLRLSRDMFDHDAFIFMDLKSRKVSLGSDKHKRRVAVEFDDFPYLGIWAVPGAPYVCIEPWHGYLDPEWGDGNILNKPGINKLAPSTVFTCVHKITIEE